ncbi:MAG: porin family protein [Shewanella sp.]|nr:porin family protein [Shewanella sp.]MCF1430468.1 porin family protein [Shewanella sp.]MCF1438282.1 porin family protein [Shewanella sp.]MCF1458143.1 porin family protein [Shewanella sp.]
MQVNYPRHLNLSVFALILGLTLSAQVCAEDYFVTPVGGYSFGASKLKVSQDSNDQKDYFSISEDANYGVMMGVTTRDPGDVYLLYSHQSATLGSGGLFADKTIAGLAVDYLHLGGTLYFPNGNWEPYVTTTVGLTQLRPDGGLGTETRFSMGLGVGGMYRISKNLALMAEVRGFATFMDTDGYIFCGDKRCVWILEASTLVQGQANLGIQFRF